MKSGCRGTLQWCTGSGKTRAAIIGIKAFLSKNTGKTITVIVPTEYLKIQWLKELHKFGVLQDVKVEIINSAIKTNTQIDLLIIDEAHRVAADTFYTIFNQRRPKLVLGLSATFSRLDGRHILLNTYCPIVDVLTVKEAITNKWLSPYVEYKVLIEPNDIDVYRELNQGFLSTFAYFDNNFQTAMQCVGGIRRGNIVIKPSHFVRYEYAQHLCSLPMHHPKYKDTVKAINQEVTANAFSWNRFLQARKSYVINHPKKLELARKILAARKGLKAITFSATIKQAEKIGEGYIVHSGKTKRKNRITMEEFAKMPRGVIHTAKSLDEGADIEGLSLAIILCNSSSQTQKTQRLGRVIRYEENKEAEVFTLVIKGTMEEGWYDTSTAGKEYIEITEAELDEILDGKKSDNLVQEGKQVGDLFRY
ncbi:MAG: DEAD/DEAH box helicase [Candidatus Saccharimonadaceae bacterium]